VAARGDLRLIRDGRGFAAKRRKVDEKCIVVKIPSKWAVFWSPALETVILGQSEEERGEAGGGRLMVKVGLKGLDLRLQRSLVTKEPFVTPV
jgi:hypothetical protein